MLQTLVHSVLYTLVLLWTGCLCSLGAAELAVVHDLDFGIRDGKAWFSFQVEGVGHVEERNLDHASHLFPPRALDGITHVSRTYQRRTSSGGVTLTIHSGEAVSILVLNEHGILEVFPRHLYNTGEARRDLEEGIAHVATVDNSTRGPWGDNHKCGAYVVKPVPNDRLGMSERKPPADMGKIGPSGTRSRPDTEQLDKFDRDQRRGRGGRGKRGGKGRKGNRNGTRSEKDDDNDEENQGDKRPNGRRNRGMNGLHAMPPEGRSLRAKAWTDCYPNQNQPRLLEVGIIADYGFFTSYGSSVDATMDAIEVVVANTNLVYHYQFNIFVRARQVIIVDRPASGGTCTPGVSPTFEEVLEQDPASGTCCHDIDVTLDIMANFSANGTVLGDLNAASIPIPQTYAEVANDTLKFKLAHWHFLSNCYSESSCSGGGSCVVGLAFINDLFPRSTLCSGVQGTNTAVSYRQDQTWLVFAHELGHNFGAPHSFEEGVGSTGGIMDYGDGKYLGEYQFNEKYRRQPMCNELSFLVGIDKCSSGPTDLFATYSADACKGQADLSGCPVGVCLDEVCTPLETQLRVRGDGFDQAFRVEISEFGPMSPLQIPVVAPFAIAQSDGCGVSPFPGSFLGTIIVVERSGCPGNVIAQNAQGIGALAVVITNNQDGAADPIPGDGFFIPTVMIARVDGITLVEKILTGSNVTGFLGGLPASDLPLFTDSFNLADFQLVLAAMCAIPLIGIAYGFKKAKARWRRRKKERIVDFRGARVVATGPPTVLDPEVSSRDSEHTPEEEALSAAKAFSRWLRRSTRG